MGESGLSNSSKEKVGLPTKMTSKKYGELLKQFDLVNIIMIEEKAQLFQESITGSLQLEFYEDYKLIRDKCDDIRMDAIYTLKAKNGRKRVFTLFVRFATYFDSKSPLPSEFFEIYLKSSLPMQTYPYFREFTHSIITKMGLPPLVIPLRKIFTAKKP